MKERLPDGTYIELVGSLFDTLLPATIMALSFLGVGLLIHHQTPDPLLGWLVAAGAAAAIARLATILAYRAPARQEAAGLAEARRYEQRFAVSYLAFAALLGAFGARAFFVGEPPARALIVGLLFGYGAGVAAGLALRPRISVPSIVVAIAPTIAVAALLDDPFYRALAALFALFLAGGIESMLKRYRLTARQVTMRRLFTTLARFDDLTGLPNRLALREHFDAAIASAAAGAMTAVHYLDLDRFKPVNDSYGHATGDALLKAVAQRLAGLLRPSDFAARIGGDEFSIVQTGIAHPGEADMLARRVVRALSQPFAVDGREVSIGTSVGYVMSPEHGMDLDQLMLLADEALYRVKRAGGGVATYAPSRAEAEAVRRSA